MITKIDLMKKKATQIKSKLSKEKAHSFENWGQSELRELKELFDYENYAESCNIYNNLSNWIDEQ